MTSTMPERRRRGRARTDKPTPPMVSGAKPVLGHALEFNRDRDGLALRGFQEQGEVFAVKLGPKRMAMVVGPDHHRTFFTETGKKLDMHSVYGFLRAMFGDVVLLAPHDEYMKQRPLLKNAFGQEKMVGYVQRMHDVADEWAQELGDAGELEVTEAVTELIQRTAGRCFLGKELQDAIGPEFWELYGHLNDAVDPLLPPNLPLPKFIRRDRAKTKLAKLFAPVIAERRRNPLAYDDVMQDLVMTEGRDGELIDADTLRNLLIGLIFASYETTIGQGAWTLILLLQHPDYLRLVRHEIDAVAPAGTPIDHTVVARLPHLNWAVREVERLRPSVDLMMRMADEDVEFGDYVVPKGWLVQVVPPVGHLLPQLFAHPTAFDPLRFAPGREEDKQDRFAVIGFGGGMHKCPGMSFANAQMAVYAATLIRSFDLELVTPDPRVVQTIGANGASPAMVRYRRRATAP
jgi:sterol 14-demethylase